MSNEASGQSRAGDQPVRRGVMLILSSPSGAGKTTLARALLTSEPDHCALSISATTRPPRPGEVDGQHYFFLDRSEFESERLSGAFLEWAEVFGHLYGTPRRPVEDTLLQGKDVLFDIDWQGARQLAESAPDDVVRVFILPPSMRTLEDRLTIRAADAPEVVARRLAAAAEEISHWHEYDYVIVNENLDESLRILRTILAVERLKRWRRPGLRRIVEDLLDRDPDGALGPD